MLPLTKGTKPYEDLGADYSSPVETMISIRRGSSANLNDWGTRSTSSHSSRPRRRTQGVFSVQATPLDF